MIITLRLARAELRKLVTTRALPVSVAIAIALASRTTTQRDIA